MTPINKKATDRVGGSQRALASADILMDKPGYAKITEGFHE